MKPTNLIGRAWALASGTRLTIACLGLLIALSAAHLAAGTVANTNVADWLRLSGLADGPHSPWFISILGLLIVNLLCGVAAGMPQAWSEARSASAVLPENPLRSEIETRLGKDAFATLARSWADQKLGRAPTFLASADGWVVVAKRGRYNRLLRWFGHLALPFAAAGGALMLMQGFQTRILVEEGSRTGVFELLRGKAPASWKPYVNAGKVLPGYFVPGIEIERVTGSSGSDRDSLSQFRWVEEGKSGTLFSAARGKPARVHGLTVHLLDYVPASTQSVKLAATASANGTERHFIDLAKGQAMDLEDFQFRVMEVQPATEVNGPAVQLEYRESGKAPEQFWVFTDFPDYDFAHRKVSAQHFTLEGVSQRKAAELLVGSEPGAVWLWGGLTCLAMLLWASLVRPEESFWIRWASGKAEFVGASPRSSRFEKKFFHLAGLLERRTQVEERAGGGMNARA